MGICASSNLTKEGVRIMNPGSTSAKVIHQNGSHQDFHHPIKASHVLSQNPGYFICCAESMYVNSRAPHVPHDEELELGQIYFLMPISKSEVSLSLQDLCLFAVKATTGASFLYDDVSSSDHKIHGSCGNPVDGMKLSVAYGGWETNQAVL